MFIIFNYIVLMWKFNLFFLLPLKTENIWSEFSCIKLVFCEMKTRWKASKMLIYIFCMTYRHQFLMSHSNIELTHMHTNKYLETLKINSLREFPIIFFKTTVYWMFTEKDIFPMGSIAMSTFVVHQLEPIF